jgi:hypothetical protein
MNRALANKPMVPTAHATPTTDPLRPMRRHIGQSLGIPNREQYE